MMHREFWEAGFRVFGLHGGLPNGKCACGWKDCPAAFKHPLISNWQSTPEWSEDQIDAMEMGDQFKTGFGVLCEGFLVIDVDARNGGVESYAKLCEAVPEVQQAGMIVETGSGGGSKHLYFRAPSGVSFVQHLADYPGLDFKSSGYVVGPGSMHASGNRYKLAYGAPDEVEEAPQALINLLRRPEHHRADYNGRAVDVSHADLVAMLGYISPDADYETWIRCGMAIHHATGGTGFEVWNEWSAKGEKYNAAVMDGHWHSFGRSSNPVTFGTLAHYASQGGWTMPVEFTPSVQFDLPEEEPERPGDLPFDISGVDLKRPPGFVGEVAAWIESQSRRPRENLAVAAALVGIGNVAGLRYIDDRDGVTTNLFAFCVAGSRTGKEAILQGMAAVHRAAGIAGAAHGTIKSEQEIVRNLIEHQAAFYVADEVGILLQKIKNAKGRVSYLEGVIGMLMTAYSKADSFMLLSGDVKRDLRAALAKEAAALADTIDKGDASPYDKAKLEAVMRTLNGLDQGLERPFLSLLGFTTPVTFDTLVDDESATNGFIGRALIFNERDTAPKSKAAIYQKPPMPMPMETALAGLYNGGNYDSQIYRVEHYGDRIAIPTDAKASVMLADALDWFEAQAVEHKAKSGLEALYLGAYELVSKVSLILAAPEGLRTAEHVRWAFALIRRDVEEKAIRVTANRENDANGLFAKIAALIGDEDGETLGVIKSRLRRTHKPEDIEKALAHMVEKGVIEAQEKTGGRGRPSIRYRMT